MSESRDRLERPVDHAEIFIGRRSESVLDDREMSLNLAIERVGVLPFFTWRDPELITQTRTTTTTTTIFRPGGIGIGRSRSPVLNRETTLTGSTNRSRGQGRGRNSMLPIWHPRTPLRDITAVMRAIERRRARSRDIEGQGNDSPALVEDGVLGSSSLISPVPSVGKVPKILLGITNQNDGETPQKKLLNSIEKVEKVVMEELHKLERTPRAKKAEREKRIRTLMSMR